MVGSNLACVSVGADLPGLMMEVRPAINSSAAGVSYLVDVAAAGLTLQGVMSSGQVRQFDPPPADLAWFTGSLRLPEGAPRCGVEAPPDGSFPARAILRRVDRIYGLPAEEYTASIQVEQDDQGAIAQYVFRTQLPRGVYDIYINPELPADCDGGPLPVFWPAQQVDSRTLNFEARTLERLKGRFTVPSTMSVDGWSLELVEPEHGDVISETLTLTQDAGANKAEFDLDFDWTAKDRFSPLLKLSPPEGQVKPTLHWDLSAIGILVSPEGLELSLVELNAPHRHVEGQVLDDEGKTVVAAVGIQSAEIAGDASSAARYSFEVETNESGVFAVDLPPGRYRVSARPVDQRYSFATKDIEFSSGEGCFCGQSIVVQEVTTINGQVSAPGGELVGAASVVAAPSTMTTQRYFDRVLTPQPLRPREAPAQLVGGSFSLKVEPGYFDFSVRPDGASGYPWLVRPRLFVPEGDISTAMDLGDLTVPYPAVLQGVVRDSSGEVLPAAIVRAWLPVGDAGGEDRPLGVIQIGETVSLGDGSYILSLPPSLSN
ncbi:carboxypeptidase regulatory-like domain-containing protein [Chondromyces apiculatus]|nr:carboxypeptidase regulatory-like domain-containing protein [Chondromyces apiculatus]